MRRLTWLLALAACATARAAERAPDLATARVVDLSHPFDERTIYWPTAPSAFDLKRLSHGPTAGGFFYAANSFCTPEHGGTHVDAPIHFHEGRRTLAEIPLDQLMGPAVVIDVTERTQASADYQLARADVDAWEKRNGTIPEGAIVLLRTGWSARWPDRTRYLGDDTPGDASRLHFPSFGRDAAQWLVQTRRVAALGVDTASIDHGASKDFIVHQLAAAANVPGLENLTNLEQLPERGAWVLALPLKVPGGTGGPVRPVAMVPAAGASAAVERLTAQAEAWDKAIVRKDRAAIEANMADDFRQIDRAGNVETKATFVEGLMSPDLQIDPYTVEDFEIRTYGDVALLSGRTRMTGRYQGKPFASHYRYIDVYVRSGDGWKVASVQISPIPSPPPAGGS